MTIPSFAAAMLQTRSYRILQQRVTDSLEGHGINMTQWIILGMLAGLPDGARLVKIAQVLGVKAPLITMTAVELLERKLIQKVAHPTDARAKLLIVTAKGRHFVDKVEAELNIMLNQLLAGATREELLAYQRVMEIIVANDSNL